MTAFDCTFEHEALERDLGELPTVLAAVADRVEGPVWREAVRSLSAEERAALARALEPELLAVEGTPTRLLAAALVVDLDTMPETVAARLGLVHRASDVHEGDDRLAAALLLRSLLRTRPTDAASIGCRLLSAPPEPGDPLLGAAILAMLAAPAEASCLGAIRTLLDRNACEADARCTAGVSASDPDSPRDEPVCTREEAQRAAHDEAARSPWSLAENPHAPTTLLALHAAYEARSVPLAFTTAQARRRFAIEATGPACADASTEGALCTPIEAEVRTAACLATMPKARTSTATFLVDARGKKLREIRRSLKEK